MRRKLRTGLKTFWDLKPKELRTLTASMKFNVLIKNLYCDKKRPKNLASSKNKRRILIIALLAQHVICALFQRFLNVMDVRWTSKQRYVLSGNVYHVCLMDQKDKYQARRAHTRNNLEIVVKNRYRQTN